MASVHREITLRATPQAVWAALADIGALHTRLVPGFVVGCELQGDERVVTFAHGATVRERILSVDAARRRVAWSAVGGRLSHHNASAQVLPAGDGACTVTWVADLLPHDMAPAIAGMIEQGLAAMKRHLEAGAAAPPMATPETPCP